LCLCAFVLKNYPYGEQSVPKKSLFIKTSLKDVLNLIACLVNPRH